MNEQETQVCPWCQTEIVWDPEIGPEEVCPHCLNELGDYRSVSVHGHDHSHDDEGDDEDSGEEADSDIDYSDYEEEEELDPYQEKVQALLDTQLEAPECPTCGELMLRGGQVRLAAGDGFDPASSELLPEPFLPDILEMDLYVCPSCFKTETYLAEPGRIRMKGTLSK